MFAPQQWTHLVEATRHLEAGFQLPTTQPADLDERAQQVLLQVAERMRDNYPYPHPLYVGQMLKPPHPLARLAYALAMQINPNNHALDGGRASSQMEREAVAQLAAMFGWQEHLGHLTSGGTMANLEALWIAGQLAPDRLVLASEQAHYTHERICGVLQIPFKNVAVDRSGRMDLEALRQLAETGEVGTVVATLGTTGLGALDPLEGILEVAREFGLRVHVDSAYGGYYTLAANLSDYGRRQYDRIVDVDSVVIDPHKHGLQPYGCGCVLFRDPQVGRFYKHDSPYTYFSSEELHLGEISLECSRAGASAVALWATQQLLPPVRGGEFAQSLAQCRQNALDFHQYLEESPDWWALQAPDLDIVVWAPRAASSSQVSGISRRVFVEAEANGLYLAVIQLPRHLCQELGEVLEWDTESLTCLRTCWIRPEQSDWQETIQGRLSEALANSLT